MSLTDFELQARREFAFLTETEYGFRPEDATQTNMVYKALFTAPMRRVLIRYEPKDDVLDVEIARSIDQQGWPPLNDWHNTVSVGDLLFDTNRKPLPEEFWTDKVGLARAMIFQADQLKKLGHALLTGQSWRSTQDILGEPKKFTSAKVFYMPPKGK